MILAIGGKEYKTGKVLIQNGGNGRGSWLGIIDHFVLFETPSRPGAREITSSAISVGDGEGPAPLLLLLLRTRIIKKESE
jgi:hypothetical protein